MLLLNLKYPGSVRGGPLPARGDKRGRAGGGLPMQGFSLRSVLFEDAYQPLQRDVVCKTGGTLAVQLRAILRATYRKHLAPETGSSRLTLPDLEVAAAATTPSTPGAASSVDLAGKAAAPAMALKVPAVRFECVWRGRRDQGPASLSIWRPLGPPGYYPVGDVLRFGLDEPDEPVPVFRERLPQGTEAESDRRGRNSALLAAPVAYNLVWRDAGKPGRVPPVTIWIPEAPPGYRAVGCVVRADLMEPPLEAVR